MRPSATVLPNMQLECQAPGIVVGPSRSEADRLTYAPV